tara:strand:+ start:244 stop:426 length:183 start_codon:yes stop_codon:yes gene_type:complete
MNKYNITIEYRVQRSYTVEAEDYHQAEEKAREGIGHHKNQDVWDYEDTVENILCEGKESE